MPPSLCIELSDNEQARLLVIARQSIAAGLTTGKALQPGIGQLEYNLQVRSAVFITLTRSGELRGCVGSLQAVEPLAQAVATSAFNAAFRDRRFGRLRGEELDVIRIEISVLSEMEPIEADSRQALLDSLQPGVDGLLLEDQGYRSTFLPKVWEKITSAEEFLQQLSLKAGLGAGHWSGTLRFHRYHTFTFAEK
ncbi:MAG: AmmeMemoRadiSam system protein A [Gammaproteobacteria bacterium]|nr:AmmeMemoRadiSam system protein A [Gammaproteobacteria bacterium]